ncbi:MAG TPA: amino acid--tRNA ligase-related protein, partial [Gaiellaceae bacterium]|nr:amino acid--tRNA ligase-related protein [Gaiellaceae bacterium]
MRPPTRFPDRDFVADVRVEAETLEDGAESPDLRRLAGRVMARRDMGKLVFLDLVDRSGRIQLLCPAARTGEISVKLGDVVGVVGHPAKSRRGEPSLIVDELEVLSEIKASLPDTFHGMTDVEARYRRRYLDLLMNEETRSDFIFRARLTSALRRQLDAAGFVEVETPVLQAQYGGAFGRPFLTHHNQLAQDLYLRIALELPLKRLIVGGLEKVYEIGKVFRNEGVDYKHNPEFTMLEWYEAYVDYRDTMERFEQLIAGVAEELLGTTVVEWRSHTIDLEPPWKRLKLVDALQEHGVWSEDEAELRALLEAKGVDTTNDKTWSLLIDHALTNYVEP